MQREGVECYICKNAKREVHLCKTFEPPKIVCDECCKNYQKQGHCTQRACPHRTP